MCIRDSYYPEMIRKYFGDGSRLGIEINYSYEKKLLGTAGGVKKAEKFFNNTFFVISGDGLTDIDLNEVLSFHRSKKAFATMVLKRIDSKFEYGVTLTDKKGRIVKFLEKPSWGSIFANTVNTGIYVFEPEIFKFIPKNKFYDFGHQVWPELLKRKKRIFGYITDSYWCDVGNITEYRSGQKAALEKNVKVIVPGEEIKPGIWVDKGTKIEMGVKLKPPCVIGKNCYIGKKTVIGSYTTLGSGCKIGSSVNLKNCTLWNNVKINKNVQLNNCVISRGAVINSSISVFDNAVITVKRKSRYK